MTNTILKALIIDFLQVKYENECEAFQNLCSEFKKKNKNKNISKLSA